jgi:hypothetical protein
MSISIRELADEIASRPLVPRSLRDLRWIEGGRAGIMVNGQRRPLAPMTAENMVALEAPARFALLGNAPHWIAGQAHPLPPQPRIDHIANQTPVKDQLDRLTCASFATLAAMEAILKKQGSQARLSEQFASFVANGDQCTDATEIVQMAAALQQNPISIESLYPYQGVIAASRDCKQQPPPPARKEAKYSIGGYLEIPNLGLSGPSIANTDYLETLLFHGNDIVVELEAAFADPDGGAIEDVQLDPLTGGAAHTGLKHAMLIVGYDRSGPTSYFICKNSYGDQVGHNGYYLLSYHYLNTYAIRGVIVESVQTR